MPQGVSFMFKTSWYNVLIMLSPEMPALLAVSEVGLSVQLCLTLADIE